MDVDEADLRVLERAYAAVVRFSEPHERIRCACCRGEAAVHRAACPFLRLARLIEGLQHQRAHARGVLRAD